MGRRPAAGGAARRPQASRRRTPGLRTRRLGRRGSCCWRRRSRRRTRRAPDRARPPPWFGSSSTHAAVDVAASVKRALPHPKVMPAQSWTFARSLSLEVRLIEHAGARPTLPSLERHLEAQERNPLGIAPLVARCRLGELWQVGAEATRLEDPGRLVVEVDGAGQRVRCRVALDEQHRAAAPAEEQCQGAADWAGSYHDDVHAGGQRFADRDAQALWSCSRSGGTMNLSGRSGPQLLATRSGSKGVRPPRSRPHRRGSGPCRRRA